MSSTTKFAHALTEIFSPFVLVALLIGWVGWKTDASWLFHASLTILFISLLPMLLSLYLTKIGKVSDKFIQNRRQRHLFYALSLGSMLLGLTVTFVLPSSQELRLVTGLAVGTLLVVMAINTRIKISIHALIGALTACVFVAGQPNTFLLVTATVIWVLVSWSRLRLHRHTFTEVALGSFLGALVGIVFLVAAEGLPLP